jgi:uncharacterized membrane protein YhhN
LLFIYFTYLYRVHKTTKMVTMKLTWQILFAISAAAVFFALLLDLQPLYLTAKPLLMITLLLYFLSASSGFPRWRWMVVAALVFSWAGDVFLIWDNMFIFGLVAFLIAHLFYIIAYHQTGAAKGELRPLDIIKFLLLGSILIWLIYPGLGSMMLPVLVYALVLLGMGIWAHKRRGSTSANSFTLVSIGVVLFVISDGMIAVNKFAFEIPAERILIMSTYMTAQYLIVRGLLSHESV